MNQDKSIEEDDIKKAAKRKYLDVLSNGKTASGLNPTCRPNRIPEWFEPETFAHAQYLFRVYGLIIAFTEFFGLILGLNQAHSLLPLLTTGNSRSVSSLFRRYISTLRHVTLWSESDPFDPNSAAYKSLKTVRGLHYQVNDKLNRASGKVPNEANHLWLSQYDMCLTQFAFFGLMPLFPKQLGYHNFLPKDYHAMYHFWRTIGYCLGMEDRYNLCSGSDAQIKELCKLIYTQQYQLPIQNQSEPTAIAMSQAIALGFSQINSLFTYNLLMHYFAPSLNIDPERYPLNSLSDRIRLKFFSFILGTLCRYTIVIWAVTKVGTWNMEIRLLFRDFYKRYFEEKYADIRFPVDKRCPFTIKINYSAKI